MTVAVGSRSGSSNMLLALLGLVVIATMLFIAFAGQDDAEIGGFADPNGTGRNGLLAIHLLAEEAGATFDPNVAFPGPEHDAVFLPSARYDDVLAEFDGSEDDTVENHQPVLEWVEDGGVLVTAVDVPEGPMSAFSHQDDEQEISRGDCSIDELAGVATLRVLRHTPVEAEATDRTCFPTDRGFAVVARDVGQGTIYRVASPEIFFNQSLDDADNAAFAARVFAIGPGRNLGLLTGPGAAVNAEGVPLDEDGNPIGLGDAGLFDLVSDKVWAMLAGLAVAGLVYAMGRGRRLGSPVLETLPIELPSSHYVEAVGRMYRDVEHPQAASAELLRSEFRSVSSRRVGMSPASSSVDLSRALSLSSNLEASEIVGLLDGPPPSDEDSLIALAAKLAHQRSRLTGLHAVTERDMT